MKNFNEEMYQDCLQENNKRRCADTVIEFKKSQGSCRHAYQKS